MAVKFSIPFLAFKIDQLPLPGTYQNQSVEGIIFNREDLEEPRWTEVWKGIAKAAQYYGPENVTFHFPVNDSDYVSDLFVQSRLIEALKRARDFGIHGVVVHSNQVRPINSWPLIDLHGMRRKVLDALAFVRESCKGSTWLALENMPVMDNYGIEIDPLFVYPSDFLELKSTNVKVIFDICHFSNTEATILQVLSGKQQKKYFPNIKSVDRFDFLQIADMIAHWHFSSFRGIANPDTQETCKEGVIPSKGTLDESYYKEVFQKILQISDESTHIVFEIQENDYSQRIEAVEMLKWAHSQLYLRVSN